MFSLVYYSQESYPISKPEIEILASKARSNNQKLMITGFLQYKQARFLQYLEGDKESVLQLMSIIEKDERHTVLSTVYLECINFRRFSNWSMQLLKNTDFGHLELSDLLHNVLSGLSTQIFSEEYLRERITRLVNRLAERQHFLSS